MNTRILLSIFIGGLLLAVTTQEQTQTGIGHHHHLKDDTKDDFKDDIFIDDPQSLRSVEGSSAGAVSDLDEEASGLGPDDEDTFEGSGTGEGSGAQPRILEVEPVPPITPAPPSEPPSTTKVITTTTSKPETEATTTSTPHEVSTHRSKTTERPVSPVRTPSPDVHIINRQHPEERQSPSFFSQPGILAAIIGGAVVGLLCAILLVMFIVYRMRKKDEGSYVLEEPRRSPRNTSYHPANKDSKEFFA